MKYLGNTGLARLIALINEKFAPLNSPEMTGVPKAPTAASGTNTTQVATTAFVQSALSNVSVDAITNATIASNWENVTPASGLETYVTYDDMEDYVAAEIAKITNADGVSY